MQPSSELSLAISFSTKLRTLFTLKRNKKMRHVFQFRSRLLFLLQAFSKKKNNKCYTSHSNTFVKNKKKHKILPATGNLRIFKYYTFPYSSYSLKQLTDIHVFFNFFFADSVLGTVSICVKIKYSVSMITKNVWCSPRWPIIPCSSVTSTQLPKILRPERVVPVPREV